MIREDRQRREEAQQCYRPDQLRCIFIAEAPPNDPERYFYFPDVIKHDDLFRGVIKAIYPDVSLSRDKHAKHKLLCKFKADGYYLIDLCLDPLEGTDAEKRDRRLEAVQGLVDRLHEMRSEHLPIIIIKCPVYDLIYCRLCKDGFIYTCNERIEFPGSGQQSKFRKHFSDALAWQRRLFPVQTNDAHDAMTHLPAP